MAGVDLIYISDPGSIVTAAFIAPPITLTSIEEPGGIFPTGTSTSNSSVLGFGAPCETLFDNLYRYGFVPLIPLNTVAAGLGSKSVTPGGIMYIPNQFVVNTVEVGVKITLALIFKIFPGNVFNKYFSLTGS